MLGCKEKPQTESNSLLKKLGLPTNKDDNWKYSDLSRFSFEEFLSPVSVPNPVLPAELQAFLLPQDLVDTAYQMVFFNGQLVEFSPLLAEVIVDNAFSEMGATLTIPQDSHIEKPIYIFHFIDAHYTPLITQPKNTIYCEASSKATIVEIYLALGPESSFTHIESNIHLEDEAKLTHIYCQRMLTDPRSSSETDISTPPSPNALRKTFQIGKVRVQQQLLSEYHGTAITLGGTVNRVAFEIDLNAQHAQSHFYSLQMPKQQQQMDQHLTMLHHAPSCSSTIIARGIVNSQARGAFTGKIVVKEGANHTKAALENKNLLLSPQAEMNTRPQLEIYNDDVQCSHGATVGHLELDALFYLKSRGIAETDAIQMLVDAFMEPSLRGIPPPIRPVIEGYLHE